MARKGFSPSASTAPITNCALAPPLCQNASFRHYDDLQDNLHDNSGSF